MSDSSLAVTGNGHLRVIVSAEGGCDTAIEGRAPGCRCIGLVTGMASITWLWQSGKGLWEWNYMQVLI